MKTVMIGNVIIISVFFICITILSIVFNNANILWWFVLAPFLGHRYEEEYDNHPTEKGGDQNAQ